MAFRLWIRTLIWILTIFQFSTCISPKITHVKEASYDNKKWPAVSGSEHSFGFLFFLIFNLHQFKKKIRVKEALQDSVAGWIRDPGPF
jgi:hypothetical protein